MMQSWKVVIGRKGAGAVDSAALVRASRLGKLPTNAFIRPEDESSDWQQVATVEWLVDIPEPSKPRYCLECDCRVRTAEHLDAGRLPCPSCGTIGFLIDYLDDTSSDVIRVPPEPWGVYDLFVCAFAGVLLIAGAVGAFALIFNPTLTLLIGFILAACGAGLFAVTFQHRSESSKYRRHLKAVETALVTQSERLDLASRELRGLKRSLTTVRDDLVASTEAELS